MAIAYARVVIHSRSKGHSAVAAAAYRASEKLIDERTGVTHDFKRKGGVKFSEVMLPFSADKKFNDREYLWNAVEFSEKRKNSQVCKEFVLALPKELDLVNQIELTKRFINHHFVDNGLAADMFIHDKGDGNPHAHIMVTTRRLEKDRFSTHKARDLNPTFGKGFITEDEQWGNQWKELQSDFFKEKNIDLSVDLNHVLPEKHQGRIKDSDNHHIKESNEITKEARRELALHDMDNFINLLSYKASVFTKRDLEKLLFKSVLYHEDDFTIAVENLLSHKDVVSLGLGDDGKERFTTRQHYIDEARLFDSIDSLNSKKRHRINVKTKRVSKRLGLSEEQRESVEHVIKGRDISVVIGKPGTGKTTRVMKAINELYSKAGYRILGAALASKAAKGMEEESGISSMTLAKMNYLIAKDRLQLTKSDVIVIDEAGMVDFASMSFLINAIKKAKSKVILVGDPEQLKPIGKGDLFRGIAAHVGYVSLEEIRRQSNAGDRQASKNLSKGKVELALSHYENKGVLHYQNSQFDAAEFAANNWFEDVQKEGLYSSVMLSFTRKAVLELNTLAHDKMRETALLSNEEFTFNVIRGSKQIFDKKEFELESKLFGLKKEQMNIEDIQLSCGERLLFKRKDKTLGVDNGDMGTIISIDEKQFTVRLDNGNEVVIEKNSYQDFDYGYALTVHKSQGMSIDNAHVVVDSPYWDKFLSFVAMTRHKKSLNIYASNEVFKTKADLTKTLSKAPVKDNVIDYPLDFAIRYGFEPDSIAGRAVNRIVGVKNKIRDTWRFLTNYESYLNQKNYRTEFERRDELRQVAGDIAKYLDAQQKALQLHHQVKRYGTTALAPENLQEKVFSADLKRDELAFKAFNGSSIATRKDITLPNFNEHYLNEAATCYEHYLTIEKIVKLHIDDKEVDAHLLEKIGAADLSSMNARIQNLAKDNEVDVKEIFNILNNEQEKQKDIVFNKLSKDNKDLRNYYELLVKRQTARKFAGQTLDKRLAVLANKISKDKALTKKIKQQLPMLAANLKKYLEIDRDRGIER